MHLGRISVVVLDATGAPVSSAVVAVYRQGARIKLTQAGPTYNVDDVGALMLNDIVRVVTPTGTVGTTDFTVTALSVTLRTVTLSPAPGTLTDDSRIFPQTDQPSLFTDNFGNEGVSDFTTNNVGRWEAYARVGLYDVKVTNGSSVLFFADVQAVSTGPNYYINAADPRYGIGFGGDDLEGVTKALNDAKVLAFDHGVAATVVLPRGIVVVSDQVDIPAGVELQGSSQTATTLSGTASLGFPASTAVVRFGETPGVAVNNARLSNIKIETDGAGGICLDLTDASFGCVVRNVRCDGAVADGVYVGAGSGALCQVDNLRVLMGSGAGAGSNGINFDGSAMQGLWTNVRVDGNATMGIGIKCNHASGGGVSLFGCHILNSTIGLRVMRGGVWASHVFGNGTTPTLVQLDAAVGGGTVFLSQIMPFGSATTLNDLIHTSTTAGDVTLFVSQSSGVISNVSTVPWTISSVVNFDGAVDFDAAAVFDSTVAQNAGGSMAGTFSGNPTFSGVPLFSGTLDVSGRVRQIAPETVASATDISITKNTVRLTGNTIITGIQIDGANPTSAANGMRVVFSNTGGAGAIAMNTGGAAGRALQGPNKSLANNESIEAWWDHASTIWRWTGEKI